MTPRLEVTGLTCGHGERALFAPLNFSARDGDIVRVAGDNGAGKTTFLRTLAGLLSPLTGQIAWQSDTDEPRPSLAFIDHDNALSPVLSPVENLTLLSRLARYKTTPDEKTIVACLDTLGLKRVAHKPTRALSAGQQRRVALARLWLSEARVWLLDEPAGALDVASRERLSARITSLAEQGSVIVYTTHEALNVHDTQTLALA